MNECFHALLDESFACNINFWHIVVAGLDWAGLDLDIYIGHGFIGYPKGRNVERALGFSLTATVSTSPNLAIKRERVARQSLLALRARALAKFGEVDTVPMSEKPSALSTFRPLGYPIKP